MVKEGMRDISAKSHSLRTAVAEGSLRVSPESIVLIHEGRAPKGDPRPIARVAAIQAAKNTPLIIPYCHPVPVDYVGVEFELTENEILVSAEVKAIYKTGVEMEALTAVSAALLNLFDLLKPVDDHMEIGPVRLLEKHGGKTQYAMPDRFSASVVVVSDSAFEGRSDDRTGPLLRELLSDQGGSVRLSIVSDDQELIRQAVRANLDVDILLFAGGTGASPRDNTPEAVLPLLEKRLDGVEHRLNAYGQERLPTAMLGRPFAGIVESTIVIGIPGAPSAARDAMAALFPYLKHSLHIVAGGGHGR